MSGSSGGGVRETPEYTTIQVTGETHRDLWELKEDSRESFEDVVRRLIEEYPGGDR